MHLNSEKIYLYYKSLNKTRKQLQEKNSEKEGPVQHKILRQNNIYNLTRH